MSRSRKKQASKSNRSIATVTQQPLLTDLQQNRETILLALLLTAFGIYKAVVLWGAFPVPNPDFPGFVRVGRELLDFRIPSSFKRAPVVGLMQVLVGKCMGGNELGAGWLINGVFSVANLLLLWRIGVRLIGRAAPYVALIAMFNPWIVRSQVNPIAETSMIFFTLLTFLLLFRKSRWSFLTASIASMVRYECTVLILIAFLMEGLREKSRKNWFRAFGLSALASVPFLLWMLGTYLTWKPGQSHYIYHFIHEEGQSSLGVKYLQLVWEGTFDTLLKWPIAAKAMFTTLSASEASSLEQTRTVLSVLSKIVVIGGILSAVIHAIWKRNQYAGALFVYLFFYVLVHSLREASHHRYVVPAGWVCLLLCWWGYVRLWQKLHATAWRYNIIRLILPWIVILVCSIWLAGLWPYLAKLASPELALKGRTLIFAGLTTTVLITIIQVIQTKMKHVPVFLALALAGCLMTSSHFFPTMLLVGRSTYYIEFKHLIDWFEQETRPGERMTSRWTSTLQYMTPSRKDDLVITNSLAAETLEEFIENCRKANITYVTWSTRGSAITKKGLMNIQPYLKEPRTIGQRVGSLVLIKRIEEASNVWINIFRLTSDVSERTVDPQIQDKPGANP
ncbi:MAG: hypothetical protein JXA82_08655 [Sedimentisphaerales bacterium]|nr:hypothetical protein [Sedimentisphaerales bacterium]